MDWKWTRRTALAACVCAGLLPAPGCGSEETDQVDGSVIEEEDAERAMEETEKVQQDLLDIQEQKEDDATE